MKLASAIYNDVYPFDTMGFSKFCTAQHPDELEGADALVVWGGADISPSLYNHKVHPRTGATEKPSFRDQIEWSLMQAAVKRGIPIIGVCRGAQMLCALAGGSLFQHVDNHTCGEHKAESIDGTIVPVSSLHHQMMNPDGTEHKLIQWSDVHRSGVYYDQNGVTHQPLYEPEYIYFPKVKGHAIQWHPEFMDADCAANIWLRDMWDQKGLSWV
jgi:putative glutamine amidotransferase